MKHRFVAALTLVMAGVLSLIVLAPLPTAQAIGEVTATPDQPAPAPTTAPTPTRVPQDPVPPATGGDVDALLEDAVALFQEGDYEGAIAIVDDALAQDPENAEAFAIRGLAYSQLNNTARAIDDLTRAINITPWDWSYHVFRADSLITAGELNDALFDLDRSIELNPRYELAYRTRAALFQRLNQNDLSELDQLMSQGLLSAQFGDFTAALDAFTQVIDLDNGQTMQSANAYYNRALTNYRLEDLNSAIADYSAGMEVAPNMHDLYLGRGIALRETGDIRGAGEDFLRRIEILEDNTQVREIACGESLDVDMAYGNVYRITFSGLGGDTVTATARDIEGVIVDPLIALLDPNGTPIAGDDDFGGELDSLIENFRLPRDGQYTLVVSHANGGYNGLIRVTLNNAATC